MANMAIKLTSTGSRHTALFYVFSAIFYFTDTVAGYKPFGVRHMWHVGGYYVAGDIHLARRQPRLKPEEQQCLRC